MNERASQQLEPAPSLVCGRPKLRSVDAVWTRVRVESGCASVALESDARAASTADRLHKTRPHPSTLHC